MGKKRVYNKEQKSKAEKAKSSVRQNVNYDLVHNFSSRKFVDRKKLEKSGGKRKHKGQKMDPYFICC